MADATYTCTDCGCGVTRQPHPAQPPKRCPACRKAAAKARLQTDRASNPARYREYDRKARARDAERLRGNWRRYYWANPELIRKKCLQWHVDNPARSLALKVAWNNANRDRARATARAWGKAHPERVRINSASRRARKADAFVEEVTPRVVFERDNWICALCAQPIDPSLRHPDLWCASVDHVLPLARGGEHSYANVQAAHLFCNISKGAGAYPSAGWPLR